MPLVKVHWQWLTPDEVDCRLRFRDGRILEEAVARRRCQVQGIRRRFTVYDAFGFAGVAWEREDSTPLTVLPSVDNLRALPVLQSLASSDGIPHPVGAPEGDRMEIRRYVPGDSVRHILWKTFARTRQLNVRIPERSIELAEKTVAYLVTGTDDEAAAAAARVALEQGVFGQDWLFGADGTDAPTAEFEPALEAIARSGSFARRRASRPAGAEESWHVGLSAFLGHPDVAGEVHCIVFAPCREGRWSEEAMAAARNFSGTISFVLGTDGLAQRRDHPFWRRLLFTEGGEPGTTREDLARLLKTLGSAGCPAVVVDRRSGRSFDLERQRTLRATA